MNPLTAFQILYVASYSLLYPRLMRDIQLIGRSGARIHPQTHLLMKRSKIVVENGCLLIGMFGGYRGMHCIDPRKDSCRVDLDNSTLRIVGTVSLYPESRIWANDAEIVIKNGTHVNPMSYIIARRRIVIGEHCLIASGVIIRDHDGHKIGFDGQAPSEAIRDITINDHCWIGHNAIVLKGVTIGKGAVIAAGSVVSRDVPDRTLVGGVPARVIRENVVWEP